MVTASETLPLLRRMGGYEDLLHFLEALGFTFADEPRSTAGWPEAVRNAVADLRVAARHGNFQVFYAEVAEQRMFTWERQAVTKLLATEPHSLFVFTEASHQLWHFVHVRYDEQLERRRQLRRLIVDLREPRGAERLRTTAQRLARIAVPRGQTLSALEVQARCDEAFRVSAVSEQFLSSFVKVVGDLTKAMHQANPTLLMEDKHALGQAQLLMDRLVFLYFVQKKRWLNGEPDYLYERFTARYRESPQADTYYRENLLPLFRALSHRNAPRPKQPDGQLEAIPFLNGGLFDLPLAYGTANPPTDERVRVPNEALYPVFDDFLERYNFTTTEDSPLDVEVAINPEVIGTIFETFVLRSENEPDTNAPDRRKATGSYYTPRVVVHFICRAVLRRYLAEKTGLPEQTIKSLIEFTPADQLTEEEETKLRDLLTVNEANELRKAALEARACDPAVGSGAFLVGLLQELVKLASLLDFKTQGRAAIQRRNYAYELKKQIVESCLYGVDIQEQAIQICELRLWLSLVIDYEPDSALPLHERIARIEPLPNLTFRVRVGDSLLDQLFGKDWELRGSQHVDIIDQLRERKRAYFDSQSPEGKRDLERQILDLQLQLLERRLLEEREVVGARLPLLSGLITAKRQKELDAAKQRLDAINDLLGHSQEARSLAAQPVLDTWEHARRFDAIRDKLGVSFVWALDFAEVFDPPRNNGQRQDPGFDIVVGNPPFVTARNPARRERYRHRWPTSCYKKYHMLAPFTELALTKLLRPQAQFGYIVSNAFATRDFGKPLVEQVFLRMELLNVVDCSGLMFPGHGTPTSVLLGHALGVQGKPARPTLLCGTRPGMGQLREEAEETELWTETEASWEVTGTSGQRVTTSEWSTTIARRHPWSLDADAVGAKYLIESSGTPICEFLEGDVGVASMTNGDEVFTADGAAFRRMTIERQGLRLFTEGEDIRDWSVRDQRLAIIPYGTDGKCILEQALEQNVLTYLTRLRDPIGARKGMVIDAGRRSGLPWYVMEYHADKYQRPSLVYFPFIATHFHAHRTSFGRFYTRTAQVISPRLGSLEERALLALLNSSSALFWLKQVCYNKGAGGDEERDRYEFAGGKVEQLPVPRILTEHPTARDRAGRLAELCSELGAQVPGLHPRKLFERPGEAYTDWYQAIRGYQRPHPSLNLDWQGASELRAAYQAAIAEMRRLRRQMVTLQEEMDWLIYGAFGLLPLDHPAVNLQGPLPSQPIDQLERPYRLVQHERPIPQEWPTPQKALWHARLEAIAQDERIGQLERPAYKRRWDEPFGDREFLDAYEWWLCEKAEWLLEHRHGGGPVALDAWAAELLLDKRVQAAYHAAREIGATTGDAAYIRDKNNGDFSRHLKRVIEEETVPDKRSAFKKKHEKLRGIDPEKHLPNGVPRERFRSLTDRKDWYVWAGKDTWSGVEGDVWDV